MKNCKENKIKTCGPIINASCVKYEGEIPDYSEYYEVCNVTVENTIEELYKLIQGGTTPTEYFAGQGLTLNNNTFSAVFGTISGTVMEGSWRPNWTDIQNRPTIPQQVNLIAGDNIEINGIYPNLTVSSNSTGEENIIETVLIGSNAAPVINKRVIVPVATNSTIGLVKPGSGITIATDGTISSTATVYVSGSGINVNNGIITNTAPNATHTGEVTGSGALTITNGVVTNSKLANMPPQTVKGNLTGNSAVPQDIPLSVLATALNVGTYVAGAGLTLTGNTFTLPVNIIGTGTFVQSVVQNAGGLTVTMGTPSGGTTYQAGTFQELDNGTSNNVRVWSPAVINQWYDNNRLAIHVFGSNPIIKGAVVFNAGNNITLTQSGNNITIDSTGGGSTYSAGNGLTLTGTVFSLPVSVSGTGNYVTDVVQNANGITVTKGTLPTFTDAITTISRNGVNIPISSQNVNIPLFDTTGAGLVPARVGSSITRYLREDGTWVAPPTGTTYSAGTGLSLTGTTFGQSITTNGTGTFVTSITQTTNGFQVNLGTPPGSSGNTQTLVLNSSGGIPTNGCTITSVYVDVSGQLNFNLPPGDFDGQVVSFYCNSNTDQVNVNGTLTNWNGGSSNVTSVVVSGTPLQNFVWNASTSRWMVGRHY